MSDPRFLRRNLLPNAYRLCGLQPQPPSPAILDALLTLCAGVRGNRSSRPTDRVGRESSGYPTPRPLGRLHRPGHADAMQVGTDLDCANTRR